jgi:hypothetical protein
MPWQSFDPELKFFGRGEIIVTIVTTVNLSFAIFSRL